MPECVKLYNNIGESYICIYRSFMTG